MRAALFAGDGHAEAIEPRNFFNEIFEHEADEAPVADRVSGAELAELRRRRASALRLMGRPHTLKREIAEIHFAMRGESVATVCRRYGVGRAYGQKVSRDIATAFGFITVRDAHREACRQRALESHRKRKTAALMTKATAVIPTIERSQPGGAA